MGSPNLVPPIFVAQKVLPDIFTGAQPEIRNVGAVLGVWGRSPQPPKTGGLGAKPPDAESMGSGGGAPNA